jgi:hypothetical protein
MRAACDTLAALYLYSKICFRDSIIAEHVTGKSGSNSFFPLKIYKGSSLLNDSFLSK